MNSSDHFLGLGSLCTVEMNDCNFTVAETTMLSNAVYGKSDCPDHDLNREQKTIRASLIRFIATNESARKHIDSRGIHIRNSIIISETDVFGKDRKDLGLDLDSTNLPFSMYFYQCEILCGIQCRDSRVRFFAVPRCTVSEMRFDRTVVDGDLVIGRLYKSKDVALTTVKEKVSLSFVKVRGSVILANSAIDVDVTTQEPSIRIDGALIGGDLNLINAQVGGRIDLTQAKCSRVVTNEETGRKLHGKGDYIFCNRGFLYAMMTHNDKDGELHSQWWGLSKAEGTLQPFIAYANVLRDLGRLKDAQEALYAGRKIAHSHLASGKMWKDKIFWLLLFVSRWLCGYGYRPLLLLCWLLASIVVFSSILYGAQKYNGIVPVSPLIYLDERSSFRNNVSWTEFCEKKYPEYPVFSAPLYAMDTLIPGFESEQLKSWAPANQANWEFTWGKIAWIANQFFALLGWIFIGALVPTFVGYLNRDQSK